jgi:hypothetical protein
MPSSIFQTTPITNASKVNICIPLTSGLRTGELTETNRRGGHGHFTLPIVQIGRVREEILKGRRRRPKGDNNNLFEEVRFRTLYLSILLYAPLPLISRLRTGELTEPN